MFFLVNKQKKFIFGTTQKAGCTFIKNLFRYISKLDTNSSIKKPSFDDIYNYSGYTIIFFLRNIYHRPVSTFMDKYNYLKNPSYVNIYPWNNGKELTFKNIVLELEKSMKNNKWSIDFLHFQKQIGNEFKKNKLDILKKNNLIDVIYIDNINWEALETRLNVKINDSVKHFKTDHVNTNICKDRLNKKILYDMTHEELKDIKYNYDDFYNEELTNIISNIYSRDNADFLYII